MLTLIVMGEAAKAQTISVADVEALPGETVAFSVDLTGGKDDTYTAFQFDVQFPATGFTTTGDYTVSSAWTGVSATVGSVDASGLATIPFASANAIQGTDVDGLVSVSFKVDEGVAVGNYDVTLKNIFLAYNTSDKDYPADVTFKVNVVSVHSVVLDETSTTVPAAASGVNVIVNRTIKANEWSTICLPFAMTAEQMASAFGNDVQLADFTTYDIEEDANEDIVGITLNFDEATSIEANHPYMIKTSSNISQFEVENVDVDPDEENAYVEYNNGKTGKKKVVYGTFEGTLKTGTTIPENCLFVSGNKFWYSAGLTTIKGFRGYFDFVDVLSDVESAGARIGFCINDETTGISKIDADIVLNNNSYWYGVDGQIYTTKPTAQGIYVKNGKKIIVK